MTFINEYISQADFAKYEIEKVNESYVVGGTFARDWTIDRDRDIYIRNVASGREEDAGRLTWTLYWKGHLIRADVVTLRTSGTPGEAMTAHKRLARIDIPEQLAGRREEILEDFREALIAHKDGGVFATATSYTLILDI